MKICLVFQKFGGVVSVTSQGGWQKTGNELRCIEIQRRSLDDTRVILVGSSPTHLLTFPWKFAFLVYLYKAL